MTTRKQILLVESAPSLRTPAENTLRQAGYEVVSVDSALRAEGILGVSHFDLAIIGATVGNDSGGLYVDEWLGKGDSDRAPMLIIAGEEASVTAFPDEAVVRAPFDANELIQRVRVFTGEDGDEECGPVFTGDAVEESLDAALGLDHIQVQESETIGDDSTKVPVKPKSASLVGLDEDVTSVTVSEKGMTDTSKIDLAMMQNKSADKPHQKSEIPQAEKLDLAADNLVPPQVESHPEPHPDPAGDKKHDYEWFMREMQKGSEDSPAEQGDAQASQPRRPEPASPASSRSQEVFIQKVRDDLSDSPDSGDKIFDWEEDAPTSDLSETFSMNMANAIAEQVAQKLLKHLNSERFLKLVREEIRAYLKNKP